MTDETKDLQRAARDVIAHSFEGGFFLAGAMFLAIDAAQKLGLMPHTDRGPLSTLAAAGLLLACAAWRPYVLAKSTRPAARVLASFMVGSSLFALVTFGLYALVPVEWPLWGRAPLIIAAVMCGTITGGVVGAWIEAKGPKLGEAEPPRYQGRDIGERNNGDPSRQSPRTRRL